MTKTGPQRYPGASFAAWYQDDFGGTAMEVNVTCLHTTEGTNLPSYGGGGSAPNLTAVPDFAAKKLRWYQHFDIETSSRALRNLSGGVETNTMNVVQVELVGTCDPGTHKKWAKEGRAHIFWPEAPDWALRGVAQFLAWMHDEHGLPLEGPTKWPAYPTSYANGGKQRMTGTAWNKFKGICGHMHVPENDHGDPGAIDFAGLLVLARGELNLPTPPKPTTPPKPSTRPAFPGRKYFRDGADNKYVTQLGKQLVKKGYGRYYTVGPGPRWGEADRKNVQAFQRAQGWTGSDADGYPGPETWRRLFA